MIRDYQQTCCDCVIVEWDKGVKSTIAVLPTGMGKTVVAANVIKIRMPTGRSMFIAHREELIKQAKRTIDSWCGVECEIEMGAQRAYMAKSLFGAPGAILSSVQTLYGAKGQGRLRKFDPMDFSTIIIDEGHRAMSSSYQHIIRYFLDGNPNCRLLLITATPQRTDGKALGEICETVAFNYPLEQAIDDGWLVKPETITVHVKDLDFSGIKTKLGDLDNSQLDAVMMAEKPLQKMIQAILESQHGIEPKTLSPFPIEQWASILEGHTCRRAITFATSVDHSEKLANILNRVSPFFAGFVSGETHEDTRRSIVKQFEAGQVQNLCNCDVFTEGFDSPGVVYVFVGAPTKSLLKYKQRIGRATRPLPGVVDPVYDADGNYVSGPRTASERKAAIAASAKPMCYAIDFAGNNGKHDLITLLDILGGDISKEVKDRVIRDAPDGKPTNMTAEIAKAIEKLRAEAEQKRIEEEAQKQRLVVKTDYELEKHDPFDRFKAGKLTVRDSSNGVMLLQNERALLEKNGIKPDELSYADNRANLAEIKRRKDNGLCSLKMAKLLKKNKMNPELPMEIARQKLNSLFAIWAARKKPADEYASYATDSTGAF